MSELTYDDLFYKIIEKLNEQENPPTVNYVEVLDTYDDVCHLLCVYWRKGKWEYEVCKPIYMAIDDDNELQYREEDGSW